MKKYFTVYTIMLIIVLLIGTSYALLRSFNQGENSYTINLGTLDVTFLDSQTDSIVMDNAYPISDNDGINQSDSLVFTIRNTFTDTIFYQVYIEETSTNPEFKNVIKFISKKDSGEYGAIKLLSEDNYIETDGVLNLNETVTYNVKSWLSSNADSTYMNKTFTARIVVVAYQSPILTGDIILYDANGGSYTPRKTIINTNGETKITLDKPVKDNMNFLGWSVDPNATTPEYYSGDMYTETDPIRLYAIYSGVQNKMGVLGEVESLAENYNRNITEINFVNMSQSDINNAYNNASIKFDFTASGENNGSVLGWLTTDPNDATKYILTVASVGTTYFTTGNCLFSGWNYLKNDDYNFINLKTINFNNIDTSNVTDMSSMFYACERLESLDISGFNTKNVIDMSSMFSNCLSLVTLDVSNFNTYNVTNMEYMFCSIDYDNQEVSVVNALEEIIGLEKFDTSQVTNMRSMFAGRGELINFDVSNFNTNQVVDMYSMFYGCKSLTSLNVSGFNTSNVTNMGWMFCNCSNLTSLNLSNFDTSKVTNMTGMFGSWGDSVGDYANQNNSFEEIIGLENFDTSKVTDMSYMFSGCVELSELDLSEFITSNVVYMEYMFADCINLDSLDISEFSTSKVINMELMFYNCLSLTSLDVSSFDTSNVTDMNCMFGSWDDDNNVVQSNSLVQIIGLENFNTSKVTNMHYMFGGCSELIGLNLSSFITTNVTKMGYMFYECNNLQILDISKFSFSNTLKSSASNYDYIFHNVGSDLQSVTTVYVKGKGEGDWIRNLNSTNRPSSWSNSNIIKK